MSWRRGIRRRRRWRLCTVYNPLWCWNRTCLQKRQILSNCVIFSYMIIWLYDIWTPQLHFLYIIFSISHCLFWTCIRYALPLNCVHSNANLLDWNGFLVGFWGMCFTAVCYVTEMCESLRSRRNSAIVLSHCRVWWWLLPIILYAVAISIIKWTVLWLSTHAVFAYLFYPGTMWAELGYMGGAKNSAAHHWLIQSSHHCPDYLWNCFSTGANKFQ